VRPMQNDPVNHPAHYCLASGAELIEFIERLPYCRGAAIKYLFRAGVKDPEKEIEDIEKAIWMSIRELRRLKGTGASHAELEKLEGGMP
jgi:hypothetical protein